MAKQGAFGGFSPLNSNASAALNQRDENLVLNEIMAKAVVTEFGSEVKQLIEARTTKRSAHLSELKQFVSAVGIG